MSYDIPDKQHETLLEVKKSKFYGCANYVDSREAAMVFLAGVKQRYPDARHHCWAYLLGNPAQPTSAAMSDDGEPSGTAGKPILNVLQHKPVGDIMIVVARYFGGIKLGAGGLVRAYSGAAQQTMETLPVKTRIPLETILVTTDFAQEQFLRHWVSTVSGEVEACEYTHVVTLTVAIPAGALAALQTLSASMGFRLSSPS